MRYCSLIMISKIAVTTLTALAMRYLMYSHPRTGAVGHNPRLTSAHGQGIALMGTSNEQWMESLTM